MTELGPRLGPLLWQFAPTKKFDAADFGGFLELLPKKFGGHCLRHVVEVRHDSFKTPAFVALLRQFDMPVVFAEHASYPEIADITSDFVYARLQKGEEKLKAGYPPKALDAWAERAKPGRVAANRKTCRNRQESRTETAARRLSLFHPRSQGARAGGGHGLDRARFGDEGPEMKTTTDEKARVHPPSPVS